MIVRNIRKGVWLFNPETFALLWAGEPPAPKPTFAERLRLAFAHIRSNGNGSTAIPAIKRWIKAVAFCLNASQVSSSGNPYSTVGLTGPNIEDAWYNFKLTECTPPHAGHGNVDNFDARASSLF